MVIGRFHYHRKLAAKLPLPLSAIQTLQCPGHFRAADGPGPTGVAMVPLSGLP